MSKKPATPFQPAHCLQFGLKVVEEANKRVTSVQTEDRRGGQQVRHVGALQLLCLLWLR
jgi:hypothetical protein